MAMARVQGPAPTGDLTHSTYIANLLDRAEQGEVDDAYWRMIADLKPELFAQAIRRAGGNQAKAARWLGVTRLKMREELRQLGLVEQERDERTKT
jgi:DNA-binding protein Fis